MGDIATLLERVEEKLDRSKAEAFAKKALAGDGFSLEDFRDQLRQIKSSARCNPSSKCCRL
jgi:signal recognition particle subunit SRP54